MKANVIASTWFCDNCGEGLTDTTCRSCEIALEVGDDISCYERKNNIGHIHFCADCGTRKDKEMSDDTTKQVDKR